MKKAKRPGFFDMAEQAGELIGMGGTLVGLNARIDWEAFRPDLNRIHEKDARATREPSQLT